MMMRTKRMEERIKARRFLKLFIRQSLVILKQKKANRDNIKNIIDLFDIQIQYNIQSQSPKENLSDKYQTTDDEDTKLYIIEDDIDKIVSIVKESKIRDGSQSLK